uniref:Signal peptidase complex subunit 1 n=1 Tax=Cairina moschata TaxID=8855 RepID=A0A8C3BY89_CAIMO
NVLKVKLCSVVVVFFFSFFFFFFLSSPSLPLACFFSRLLTLPPWPMYRCNPLKWLPGQESGTDDKKPADREPRRH